MLHPLELEPPPTRSSAAPPRQKAAVGASLRGERLAGPLLPLFLASSCVRLVAGAPPSHLTATRTHRLTNPLSRPRHRIPHRTLSLLGLSPRETAPGVLISANSGELRRRQHRYQIHRPLAPPPQPTAPAANTAAREPSRACIARSGSDDLDWI